MNETFSAASILILAIRLSPSNLHLRGHGDHVLGVHFGGPTAELAIASLDDCDSLIVRGPSEVRHVLKVVAQPGVTTAVCGAVVRSGAGRADELGDKSCNEWLEGGSTRKKT